MEATSTRLVGKSRAHNEVLGQIESASKTDVEVVFMGPSGVGKELYARTLHEQSQRNNAAFVAVNCGAVPLGLFENELFGHVGGAFTGARPSAEGLVSQAERGTLFLDEIDTLEPAAQVKLLRFLQQREYRRLGETALRRSNVRVVAASNADLRGLIREGRFREDLFYRIHVFPIQVAPLRQRIDDLDPLLAEFIRKFSEQWCIPPIQLTPDAMRRLESYTWPGNVRELENCVRYLTALRLRHPVTAADLKLLDDGSGAHATTTTETPAKSNGAASRNALMTMQAAKRSVMNGFERKYLIDALRAADGNIARAAQASGKPRRAFFELMRKHNLRGDDYRRRERADARALEGTQLVTSEST